LCFTDPKREANGLAFLVSYLEEENMTLRGVRGAIVVEDNQPDAILSATRDLLAAMLLANPSLQSADLASVFFTMTEDLDAMYPALASREMGWDYVPILCGREIPVPGGQARCIRALLHWNTDLPQDEVRHVYLGEAASLRPDLASKTSQYFQKINASGLEKEGRKQP
jgi:chorismate mutase